MVNKNLTLPEIFKLIKELQEKQLKNLNHSIEIVNNIKRFHKDYTDSIKNSQIIIENLQKMIS